MGIEVNCLPLQCFKNCTKESQLDASDSVDSTVTDNFTSSFTISLINIQFKFRIYAATTVVLSRERIKI